jgi:hypothetical protein
MRGQSRLDSFGTILAGVAHRLGLESKLFEARLRRHWPEIVGEPIATHTRPDQLRFRSSTSSYTTRSGCNNSPFSTRAAGQGQLDGRGEAGDGTRAAHRRRVPGPRLAAAGFRSRRRTAPAECRTASRSDRPYPRHSRSGVARTVGGRHGASVGDDAAGRLFPTGPLKSWRE